MEWTRRGKKSGLGLHPLVASGLGVQRTLWMSSAVLLVFVGFLMTRRQRLHAQTAATHSA